jgi:polyisoprenyl-phosphate glycosyltransferase
MNNNVLSVIVSSKDINQESVPVITDLLSKLKGLYSDYEVLIIHNVLCDNNDILSDLLKKESYLRVIDTINPNFNEKDLSLGFELAIGDIMLTFNPCKNKSDTILRGLDFFQKRHKTMSYLVGIGTISRSFKFRIRCFFYSLILRLISVKLSGKSTCFRVISRNHINIVLNATKPHNDFFIRLAQVGYMPIYFSLSEPNTYKKSIFLCIIKTFRLLVYNSTIPLRFMTIIAFISSGVSLCVSVYAMASKLLLQTAIPGWTSLMVIMSMFFFILFLILSFISEYLTNILSNLLVKKFSVIGERTSNQIINTDRINVYGKEDEI